jgi:hypothetical protein
MALDRKRQPLHMHREFAGSGAEEIARHADVVAEIEQFVEREALLADRIKTHIDLQTARRLAAVWQIQPCLGRARP